MERVNAFILACLISVSIAFIAVLFSPPQKTPSAETMRTAEHSLGVQSHSAAHTESSEEGTEFWPPLLGYRLKVTDTLVAFFTAGLFVATWWLYRATRKLVLGAEETAERQLRAYVSFARVHHTAASGFVVTENFRPVRLIMIDTLFKNAGVTPALDARVNSTYAHIAPDQIDTFEFPEIPIPEGKGDVLPPNIEQGLGSYKLPLADAISILNGNVIHCILIRIAYRDMIKPKCERHTQIAFRIGIHADPTPYFDRGEALPDKVVSCSMIQRFSSLA